MLYAVAGAKATIGLPEVIEREIGRVLPDLAEQGVRNMRRDITMLRQLSGHEMLVTGPTALAIAEGITLRWKQLAGSIEHIPFTFDQAQSALTRIIEKAPPRGENNEQFRDCCIWDAALSLGADRVIHLVSSVIRSYWAQAHYDFSALVLYFVLTYPLFSWMYANQSFASLLTTQVILCCLLGAMFGPISTALAEQFQAHVRTTGLGAAYNMAVMLFGGFAPFFVTWLIQATGLPIAPAFYVMFGAVVGILAALLLKERAREAELVATDLEATLS